MTLTAPPKPQHKGFYDYGRILSHNAVMNFICGGRGIGKSFGGKKLAVDDNIKNGYEFMYVRRYREHISSAQTEFMADIIDLYPDYEFKNQGNKLLIARKTDKKKSWRVCGHFIPLSTSHKLKSVPFPKVRTIIYDEFIAEPGEQYIKDEATVFLNLLNTVDRYRDFVRAFFLANAVSITNPQFLAYNIKVVPGKIVKYREGFIAADFPTSDEYRKSIAKTRLGRFVQDTEYGKYAVDNEFADNADDMIGVKTPGAVYKWSIEVSAGTYSIWRDSNSGHWYAQAKLPKRQNILTIVVGNMTHEKMFVTYADLPLASTRTAFRYGRMSFDSPTTRNALAEIFKR